MSRFHPRPASTSRATWSIVRSAAVVVLAAVAAAGGCASPSASSENLADTQALAGSASQNAWAAAAAPPPVRGPAVPPAVDPARNREKETATQDLAYPTGDPRTSVILLRKRFPAQARLNQPYRYELTVTNLTDWPVAGVLVREDFPASFTVLPADGSPPPGPEPATPVPTSPSTAPADAAQPPTATDLEPAGPDVRYVPNVGYVRDVAGTWWATGDRPQRRGTIAREFRVGQLEARGTRTIPVAGRSEDTGKLETRSTVTYTPVLAGGTDVINPILKVTRDAPRHADLCDGIEVRYVVSNVGTGTETEVRVEEALPDGLTTADGKPRVTFAVGDLPQGASRPFSVRLKAARTGEFAGRATARGTGTTAQSAEGATAFHAPKLEVAMAGPASEYVGRSASYELTVRNVGDAVARNAAVTAAAEGGGTDGRGAEVTFPAAAGGGEAAAGGQVRAVGPIEPGQARTVRIAARPTAGGAMAVRATAKADCADAAVATVRTTVQTIASLVMEVTDRDDPVRVGEATVYRITVRNVGSGADSDVKVVATLPEKVELVGTTGMTPGKADGRRVTFDALPKLDAGGTATWVVEVKATEAGDARFRAELTSGTLAEPVIGTQSTRVY